MRGGTRVSATGLLTFVFLLLSGSVAASAFASDTEDRIRLFEAEYAIGADGVITVTETRLVRWWGRRRWRWLVVAEARPKFR